jgi:hypothetical protein
MSICSRLVLMPEEFRNGSAITSVRPSPVRHTKQKTAWKIVIFSAVLVLVAAGGAIYLYANRAPSQPLPAAVIKASSFSLYYPTDIPDGYALDRQSIQQGSSLMYFTIKSSTTSITFTEQAAPAIQPDFDTILKKDSNYKKIDAHAGDAILGLNGGVPVAILKTNTTLINASASRGTPSDAVSRLTQSMTSIAR